MVKYKLKDTEQQQCRENSFMFFSLLLCFLLFGSFSSLPALADEDYDSLIVKPKEVILKSKKLNRAMYRVFPGFRKINDNSFVIPLNLTNNEMKKVKIAELQNSRLFDLVEPDYKFSLDTVPMERKYIKITKESEEAQLLNNEDVQLKEITPNDKGFTSQYYLREISATKAWSATVGDDALLIGVLDTGVDANHPDLQGKVLAGSSLSDVDLMDDIGHGTEVSGIIAANTNNNQGIAGITWNTKIVSLKITDEYGQAKVSALVTALEQAYLKGVKIVQISLSTNQFSQVLKNTIQEAHDRGILIVSTSGNTGIEELRYPATFDGVIGVGAVNESKQLESYSTTGEHVTLVAPGSYIYTTSSNSTYNKVSGTSFSAPQIAGAAALVWSINPRLTNDQIKEILIRSAEDLGDIGKDKKYGYGILNAARAVEMAKTLK